jgi:hypothetical protein
MTAVRRIKPTQSASEVSFPDEAATYLFGPLVTAIRKEARDAIAAATQGKTTVNVALAASVQNNLAADMFHIAGKSGFWRAVGVGLVGLGVGAAVGLGFFGYSSSPETTAI